MSVISMIWTLVIMATIGGQCMATTESTSSQQPSAQSSTPQELPVTNTSDGHLDINTNTSSDSSTIPSTSSSINESLKTTTETTTGGQTSGAADTAGQSGAQTDGAIDGQKLDDNNKPVINDTTINRTTYVEPLVNDLPSVPTPAPPNEMLSFEEWRKKIAEKAVHQQQQQLQQQQQQQQQNAGHSSSVGQQSASGGQQSAGQMNGGGGQTFSGSTITAGQVAPDGSGNVQTVSKPKVSKRARNFASNECGAKIVDSNPESESVLRILNEQTDEYMLNPCKAKIWFVVELCETIQPKHIELANFELYSSVPKEFNIQVSDHYPTRDWSSLGTFQSKDERSVQRFAVQTPGFVKFVKIELLSHYGTEHFCPLSVVRVFGTSLFEEVERIDTIDANQMSGGVPPVAADEDESTLAEDMVGEEPSSNNLFGTARDAVFDIMRKAVQSLNGNSQEVLENTINETNITNMINASTGDCVKLSAIRLYPKVDKYLHNCTKTINNSISCLYLKALFGDQLYSLMIDQYLTVNNESNLWVTAGNGRPFECNARNRKSEPIANNESIKVDSSLMSDNFGSILPTKPMLDDWAATPITAAIDSIVSSFDSASIVDTISTYARSTPSSTSVMPSQVSTAGDLSHSDDHQLSANDTPILQTISIESAEDGKSVVANDVSGVTPIINAINDSIAAINGDNKMINETASDAQPVPIVSQSNGQQAVQSNGQPIPTNGQLLNGNTNGYSGGSTGQTTKESVVIRLSNRIKALEVNLSLSSQYLEQLSQRYRKQMEEMQRAFNITISKLNDTNIRAADRDLKQQESIAALETKLNTLSTEMVALLRDREDLNWHYIEVHIALMMIEVIIVVVFLVMFGHRLSQRIQSVTTQSQGSVSSAQVSMAVSPQKRSHPYGNPCHLPTKTIKFEDENKPPELVSNNSSKALQRKIRKKKRKTNALNGLNGLSQSSTTLAVMADSLKTNEDNCGQLSGALKEAFILKSQSTPALTVSNKSLSTTGLTSRRSLATDGDRQPFGTGLSNGTYSSCHSSTSGVSSNSTISTNISKQTANHLSMNSSPKNEIKNNTNINKNEKKSMISRNNKSSDNKSTNLLTSSLKKLLKFERKMN